VQLGATCDAEDETIGLSAQGRRVITRAAPLHCGRGPGRLRVFKHRRPNMTGFSATSAATANSEILNSIVINIFELYHWTFDVSDY